MIERTHPKLSVGAQCKLLSISRSSFYYTPQGETAMNRRNALFVGHDEGGRSWARFASLIGSCKMNAVEPYSYLVDLFTRLANGHLDKDIDALMPWAYSLAAQSDIASIPEK